MSQVQQAPYSVTRGKEAINWWEIIDKLRTIRDKVPSYQWGQLKYRPELLDREERLFFKKAEQSSQSWVTCACGNQCSIIPRHGSGVPVDNTLARLGKDFYLSIRSFDLERATQILESIEQRSANIINEMLINDIKSDKTEVKWNN